MGGREDEYEENGENEEDEEGSWLEQSGDFSTHRFNPLSRFVYLN